jgi:arylsulfatase A-like enzyme
VARGKRFAIAAAGACLAGGLVVACPRATTRSGESTTQSGESRNLVLISIDTLRADVLGCYGFPRPTSPTLDALAARGVLFETALATAPWTLPSHASLLTGRYPSRNGVRRAGAKLPADVPTWAAWLQERGFATLGIVNSRWLETRSGLDRGFGHHHWVEENVRRREPSSIGEIASAWLSLGPPEPFFLFLHLYDLHSDYRSLSRYERMFETSAEGRMDGSTRQLRAVREGQLRPQKGDRARLLELYAASVRQVDDVLARLVRTLEDQGLMERTFLVLTSDHGEEFLEHGSVLHGRTQFDEVLRVPLILVGPGLPPGVRVREPVSLVDVMPTALALLGQPAPAGVDGVDLGPLWAGDGASLGERFLFGEADWRNEADEVLRSVRRGPFKLIHDRRNGARRLYDLVRDPREQVNVVAEHPEIGDELWAALEEFASGARASDGDTWLSTEDVERLQALGYF